MCIHFSIAMHECIRNASERPFKFWFFSVFRPNPLSGMAWQCWKNWSVWEFQRWSQQMQRNNWQHRWQNLGQHLFVAHEAWKGCNFRILLILWRFFWKTRWPAKILILILRYIPPKNVASLLTRNQGRHRSLSALLRVMAHILQLWR